MENELQILISFINGEYLIFDVEAVKRLRTRHHMAGMLVGTLPQVPQQSVFLGLPLQLMAEEAALLVEKGAARVVDEAASHAALLAPAVALETDVNQAVLELEQPTGQEPFQTFTTPTLSSVPTVLLPDSALDAVKRTPRFQVYKYLNEHGYFISPGLRFGCQFVAYPGDPLRYHSHYLVRGLAYDEEFPLMDMVASGRLGTSVKKAWMVGGRKDAREDEDAREDASGEFVSFCIEWAGFG